MSTLEKAEKQLAKIEHQKRTWKSDSYREHEIWSEIAMQLNSAIGAGDKDDQVLWSNVMNLFNKKYSNNEL